MSKATASDKFKRYSVEKSHLELAQHCLLFRGVDTDTLHRLPSTSRVLKLSSGDTLMSMGQENDNLYLILDGELGIQVGDEEHHYYVTLQAGECVGELSLIDECEVSAEVAAVTDSQLLELRQESLWSLIEGCYAIARNLLHILSRRLRDSNQAVNDALEQRAYFEKAAYLDSLTGVHNRRWLDKAFPRELDRCHTNCEQLSFAITDIDFFKKFNDKHGHLAGDIVLRAVAQMLAKTLRPTDLLARFGGEEFAIVFPRADAATVIEIAERIRQKIAALELKSYDGTQLPPIKLSVGITTMQRSESLNTLIGRADKALYQAKENGRDQIVSL